MSVYTRHEDRRLWVRPAHGPFPYTDGEDVESRLYEAVRKADDCGTFSNDLRNAIQDWPSEYHFSRERHCLLRPFEILPSHTILELGCGCGALTRYLGELGARVDAVEGSALRASIAAERCADLPNVSVYVDDLTQFEQDKHYDWVLLIGVLEYAPVFTQAPDPTAHYLQRAKRFLADRGSLILAIENKLGLKYFNGCSEDHMGRRYFGLQGLYGDRQPRTFGKQELHDILAAAGLPHLRFFYPFPDYKLPRVIFSDEAFSYAPFQAHDMLLQMTSRDYTHPDCNAFYEGLVWAELERNELLPALSNSFLVRASAHPQTAEPAFLAANYSVNRVPDLVTQTLFIKTDQDLTVDKQPIASEATSTRLSSDRLSVLHQTGRTPYCPGNHILADLLRAYARDPRPESAIATLGPWFDYVWSRAIIPPSLQDAATIPLHEITIGGEYLDCTPFNLLREDEQLSFIDREWVIEHPIPFGWVLSRSLLYSFTSIPDLGPGAAALTVLPALRLLLKSYRPNIVFKDEEMHDWKEWEDEFIGLTVGTPLKYSGGAPQPLYENELVRWRLAAETYRRSLEDVHMSLSWRVTSPVRSILGWLRHIKARKGTDAATS